MTAETQTLNFGPEWLRALSSGGSVTSPPLSPALPKYKLADYRYGREEMLALYVKDNKVPSDLLDKEFLPILKEEPLLPLALVPFTEEEQRNFSMSVNSAAVLRLMGRGSGGVGGTVVGVPRGRSCSRGRACAPCVPKGRGRGDIGFYQRSFDEVDSGFGRGAREMHRSQSWEERGDRRFEKPARKEPDGARGGAVWREHPERRRRFDFDFREREDERGYRRTRSGSGSAEDERDSLPEWCLEDAEDETGTFDSSGAFLPSKKVQKESIPEEQELDFRPSMEGGEHSDTDRNHTEEAKETERSQPGERVRETGRSDIVVHVVPPAASEHRTPSPAHWTEPCSEPPPQKTASPLLSNSTEQSVRPQTPPAPPTPPIHKKVAASHGHRGSREKTLPSIPHSPSPAFSQSSASRQVPNPHPGPAIHPLTAPHLNASTRPVPSSVCAAPGMGTVPPEPDEEDGLEHLEQQAQQLVAYLQDGTLDDYRLSGKVPDHRVKGPSLDNQQKWYYKDPQGETQGPFSNHEMAEWFQAGYFPMSLLLRRVCDEAFQPLGDIIKMWGRVPFTPPPAPRLGDLDPERLSRHQEITALYQLQHLQYQQFLIQQQYNQVLAQQQKAALSSQQRQQLALLLQQFQSLKMRISEQNVIPAVTRAVSVPDSTSIWELKSAVPPPTAWEGSSVWDLPLEPASQGAGREQLEKLEKVKAAKQERQEAELRANQEEEQQRRRHEEEERQKRQEEEELARRKQEEVLRRQREQELVLRRQMEEEERQREEEQRQLEEERRRQLEEERRRQQQEEERTKQQQEEERRKQQQEEERKRAEEERRRREEEKKREEEEKRQREEIQMKQEEAVRWAREEEAAARRLLEETRLKQQEEEERKKREEAQRQKELQRQRQQQQEALRRLQQQQQQQQLQLAQIKLPSSSTWGQQTSSGGVSQSALSMAEIQKLEEEREQQQREEQRRQQQELKSLQQQQLQQQQQQQKMSGWGSVSNPSGTTKSLLEIQQEEARQMQKNQQQAGRARPANIPVPAAPTVIQHHSSSTSPGSSVWGALNSSLSPQWAPDSMSSIWGSPDNKSSSVGFWDEAVKEVAPRNTTSKNKSNASKAVGVNSRQSKKVEQEEKLLRLFQGATKCQDGFTQWCEQTLHALNTAHSLDVPTFVSFLREVDSAYEVHDYVRAYLGDTAEAKDFSMQFLERRAKQKVSQQRQQQDTVWGVYQTTQNNAQQLSLEAAQNAGRKKKKQKMVRADPSLLGFSVNASSERLNMGEIETVEDY
ncbi:GRB10-interacting GYF protein 2 isoform X10 [Ascaphus truei]|uniref:GRB10-interacting GYF protein 2 isoform X10 n=1 Tax=Ascaphus truei TaxID=8439 RepID=UPI003F59CC20